MHLTYLAVSKMIVWHACVLEKSHDKLLGIIISTKPLQITCG